jgi:DNA-binding NarL/FixJ family response regulator
MRQGIVQQLSRGNGITVVGEASHGQELFQLLDSLVVDVVLLDLQMPELNGPQSLIKLKSSYPNIKVLVFSMFNEKRMMREMLRLGAHGYVTKDISTEELVDAIYNVQYRGYHAQNDTMRQLLDEVKQQRHSSDPDVMNFGQFKDRDLQVLQLICEGLSSEEIAPRVQLSKPTVDLIRSKFIAHFGARNVVHMVAEAMRLGVYIPRS